MLEAAKLEQLRQAVAAANWIDATNACVEMKLERRDPFDRFRVEELAKAVRKRDAVLVLDLIQGLRYPPATGPH